ncbi:MAG: AhpC/TSA family protein [Novosphingobium sp.]|nr:AhpC/TSA family protein [Novosphingobium sp.]
MTRPIPAQPVPSLRLPLVGGGTFDLSQSTPENFTLLLFYRGYHCPICKGQLQDMQGRLDEMAEMGIAAVAISMDDEDRASRTKTEWELPKLDLAYGLSEQTARAFGLYITSAITDKEPAIFSEPGLFVVRPDGTLYCANVQSMPFTRPPLAELLPGLGYAISHGYPSRGTVA